MTTRHSVMKLLYIILKTLVLQIFYSTGFPKKNCRKVLERKWRRCCIANVNVCNLSFPMSRLSTNFVRTSNVLKLEIFRKSLANPIFVQKLQLGQNRLRKVFVLHRVEFE